ncbi:Glycinol 4-dimethylallyltransferase [Glycine max]|nr:Glycinol 4-dimethylallyltransferase [Glycine max]
MDSMHVIMSSPNAPVTTGGNLWRSKHSTEKIYHASSCASKASQNKRKIQMEYNLLRFQHPSLNHHYKCIEGGSAYQEWNKKYVVKATSKPSFDSGLPTSNSKNMLDSVKNFLAAFYLFCYPYIMIGRALVPYTFLDVYINGLNQLSDIEIDKINKPYLPLASGQLSFRTGVIIAGSSLILSFWLGWIIGSWPLIWSLVMCFSLWTAYSINVPLLRWKRHPLLAAMCIFLSFTIIFPITFFLHMQTFVLKRPFVFPRSLVFVIVFMSFYTVGIALFKDIPDIEGDKKYGIHSFSARLGQKRVFWICVSLFEMAFGVALLAGAASSCLWIKIVTGLGHAALGSVLWYQAKYVDLTNKVSMRSFYMLIWKLLSVAYFLMPLIR